MSNLFGYLKTLLLSVAISKANIIRAFEFFMVLKIRTFRQGQLTIFAFVSTTPYFLVFNENLRIWKFFI